MTMLPIHKLRIRRVPLTWHDSAWTVPILVRSARPVFRRVPGLRPMGRNTGPDFRASGRGLRPRSLLGLGTPSRAVAATLRGRISSRRALRCDPATLSRLTAFAGLPLCRLQAPSLRIFRVFQHSEFVL